MPFRLVDRRLVLKGSVKLTKPATQRDQRGLCLFQGLSCANRPFCQLERNSYLISLNTRPQFNVLLSCYCLWPAQTRCRTLTYTLLAVSEHFSSHLQLLPLSNHPIACASKTTRTSRSSNTETGLTPCRYLTIVLIYATPSSRSTSGST